MFGTNGMVLKAGKPAIAPAVLETGAADIEPAPVKAAEVVKAESTKSELES